MSAVEVVMRLTLVAVLAGYLFLKRHQRLRNLSPRYDPAKWTGHAIDTAKLKPKLEDVRRNYLTARHSPRGNCFHRTLLGLARRAAARLAFFRDKGILQAGHQHGN
ncbi:MAG TPA: hypothetical protein VL793_05635 [Patescibacteria group bacterium]|nr:hypothetical protein [Patescibacteria group bacterium]